MRAVRHFALDGKRISDELVGRVLGGLSDEEASRYLIELEGAGVFSRQEDGTIFSRAWFVMRRSARVKPSSASSRPSIRTHREKVMRAVAAGRDQTRMRRCRRSWISNADRSGETLRERLKKPEAIPAAAFSPALEMARWFVETGIAEKALQPDLASDLRAATQRLLGDPAVANAMLASYSPEEIELRARRFFALKAAGKVRRPVTIATFHDAWTWKDVAQPTDSTEKDERFAHLSAGFEAV